MQRLWARVLKGEAKKPGTFTVHTMEFLSRMSQSDAELIANLGNFALNGRHIFSGTTAALEAAGLTLDKLLYLSDLGIISGVTGLNTLSMVSPFVNATSSNRHAVVACHDKALIFCPTSDAQDQLEIIGYPISIVGRELLTLATCKANVDYLKEVAEAVRAQCESISVGQVVSVEGTHVQVRIVGPI
jgi:hypothetical protein